MPKTVRTTIIAMVVMASLILSFAGGCTVGNITPPRTDLGLDVVSEAWTIIFQDFVEKDRLDASTMSGAAIEAMVEALDDPYSAYMDARTYQLSSSDLQGKFEGIGAFVGVRDEKLVIIAPIPGSPAEKAGIKSGDTILEVEGNSTSKMSLEEAILHIRGPRGTTVSLLILHQDQSEAEEIKIIRDKIEITSVSFEMKGDIAYININHFSERTDEELMPVLEEVRQKAASGIILDLRHNPGGLLDVVVDVAGHFIKEGTIVKVVDNQGRQTSLSAKPQSVNTDLPVVVLTDNFSASGSEVLAGALQDYGRAKIAGTMTFGKGSVDTLHRLKDGSGLYLTTARWLTPNGHLIEGKGITPDIEIKLEGDEAIQWAIDYLKSK